MRVFGDYQNLLDEAEPAAWNIFNLKSPQQIAIIEERERIARISATPEEAIPINITHNNISENINYLNLFIIFLKNVFLAFISLNLFFSK